MRKFSSIGGIVLILVGIVWALQGVNILRGSIMSGRLLYSWLGLGLAAIGLIMLLYGTRGRTTTR
jgi:hypothetical protein